MIRKMTCLPRRNETTCSVNEGDQPPSDPRQLQYRVRGKGCRLILSNLAKCIRYLAALALDLRKGINLLLPALLSTNPE